MDKQQLGSGLRSFNLRPSESFADGISLSNHMTLRNACVKYRDSGGISWIKSQAPEMSGGVSEEQIPCLNVFSNRVGHVVDNTIICYALKRCSSVIDMIEYVTEELEKSISDGRLWAPSGTISYTMIRPGHWESKHVIVTNDESIILSRIASVNFCPVSASTVHAAVESSHYADTVGYSNIFKYPHNASPSAGLIGTLHDNQCIDMNADEDSKAPNVAARSYNDDYVGFICAGHTSHSSEAGRIRRVTCNIRVRVLSEETITELLNIINAIPEQDNSARVWTVFCMGYYCKASIIEVAAIAAAHKSVSSTNSTSYSLHVYADAKLVIISVSSGTLLKLTTNGYWADSVEVHHSDYLKTGIHPIISKKGPDQLMSCFSAFFNLIPYISSDRAPRPLFSSVQTPQAVCLPWCPGTAAVSPCYTFSPIVTTPLYASVMTEIDNDKSNISSYLPGENVVTLYLNLPNNYEDAILVSKRYLDNGGFTTMSICTYMLSGNEYIPPINSMICSVLCKWWKSPCQRGCKHTVEYTTGPKRYTVGYVPTGVMVSSVKHPSGDISVRVRSHQQLQQGDKLSTGHGQKGIAVITEYHDMPIALDPEQGAIIPDVVVAMSSIVTRQTNGQLYEAAKAMSAMSSRSKIPIIVNACETADVSKDVTVRSGITGERYMTAVYDSNGEFVMRPTRATLGISRMFNQTQMTRERHHVSHLSPGKRSVRTPTGRTGGGGIKLGEMEAQVLSSGGLHWCEKEILSRGDRGTGRICTSCQRLGLLCTCTTEEHHVQATLPEDLRTLDITSYIVYHGSFQYVLEPEFA